MSSILDSLKKLEKETAQQEQLQAIAGVETKAVVSKRMIALIGVFCLCVVAIGAMVYYQGSPDTVSEIPATKAAPTAKPATHQDNIEKQPSLLQDTPAPLPAAPLIGSTTVAAAAPEVEDSGQISAKEQIAAEGDTPKQSTAPAPEKVAALEESPEEKQGDGKSLPEPEPKAEAVTADTSDSATDVSPEEPIKKNETVQIDRLEGVSIKIQAISWSEVSEQSLAVVNSQVAPSSKLS